MALRALLERTLREADVPISSAGLDAFVNHILECKGDSFTWSEDGEPDELRDVSLSFSKEDIEAVQAIVADVHEALPGIVDAQANEAAARLFKTLKKSWKAQGAEQRKIVKGFKGRLEERWGEGLNLLRMLLTCCREIGGETCKRYRRSKSKRHQYRRFVLIRLHFRGCQVADEIITLLENGFADGAMARWRTLHEIAVISTIIATRDEELAERYILHDAVDVKREADEHDRSQVPLGQVPVPLAERKEINEAFQAVVDRFGDDFKLPYGWAAPGIKGKPTFDRLQEEAGRAGTKTSYKLASYNVHAGARSLFHRLTDLNHEDTLIGGRSNAGLLEPGRNTAFTLTQITRSLFTDLKNLDQTIQARALLEIRDAVPKAFQEADAKLRRDDAAFRRRGKRRTR